MVQGAAMYMQERIEALRRDIDKHGKAKAKKGQQAPPAAKVKTPPPPPLCVSMNHGMQLMLSSLPCMMDVHCPSCS